MCVVRLGNIDLENRVSPAMTAPTLFPGSADALLVDLVRFVIDIDFKRATACWAHVAATGTTSPTAG